jgi:hypothetical protein
MCGVPRSLYIASHAHPRSEEFSRTGAQKAFDRIHLRILEARPASRWERSNAPDRPNAFCVKGGQKEKKVLLFSNHLLLSSLFDILGLSRAGERMHWWPESCGLPQLGLPADLLGSVSMFLFVVVLPICLLWEVAAPSGWLGYGKFGPNKSTSGLFRVSPRLGWFLLELPCSTLFLFVQLVGFSGETLRSPLVLMFLVHYTYRGFIFPVSWWGKRPIVSACLFLFVLDCGARMGYWNSRDPFFLPRVFVVVFPDCLY